MQLLHIHFCLNSPVRWVSFSPQCYEGGNRGDSWETLLLAGGHTAGQWQRRPWPKSVSRFYDLTSSGNYWGDTASIGQTPWINRTRMLCKGIQVVVIFERSYLKAKGGLKDFFKFLLSLSCSAIRCSFVWLAILNTASVPTMETLLQVKHTWALENLVLSSLLILLSSLHSCLGRAFVVRGAVCNALGSTAVQQEGADRPASAPKELAL